MFCQPGKLPGASLFHDSVFRVHIRHANALPCEKIEDVFDQLDDMERTQQQPTGSLNVPVVSLRQGFKRYLHELPVVGSNSGTYDLNVIRSYLLSYYYSRWSEDEEEEETEQQFADNDASDEQPTKFSIPFHVLVEKNNNECVSRQRN